MHDLHGAVRHFAPKIAGFVTFNASSESVNAALIYCAAASDVVRACVALCPRKGSIAYVWREEQTERRIATERQIETERQRDSSSPHPQHTRTHAHRGTQAHSLFVRTFWPPLAVRRFQVDPESARVASEETEKAKQTPMSDFRIQRSKGTSRAQEQTKIEQTCCFN